MKFIYKISVFTMASFLFIGANIANAEEYKLLQGLPGINPSTAPGAFTDYLQSAFNLGISIAVALAVVMIVWGGAQYLSTDAIFGKELGREKINKALLGLLLALGAVLILKTINPDILNLNLDIKPLNPSTQTPTQSTTCSSCANLSIYNNILVKPGACGVSPCRVNVLVGENLKKLIEKTNGQNINWQITEAWPPTVNHVSPCHYNGTCVDANLTSEATPQNINDFIIMANDSGLNAVYEVKTDTERLNLLNRGVLNVRTVSGINAPHFHIEND